jgi:phosphoribosylamine--glycine ligase
MRVLTVGSWAKEQITVENIRRAGGYSTHAWLDTNNPGITSRVDSYSLGSLHAIDQIVAYAVEEKVDLVLPTTASPLSLGLVDALTEEQVPVFGPSRSAARLESDKAWTRRLMQECCPEAIPEFRVFTDRDEAVAHARERDWEVAVKPTGLTEGLGVKVYGDQLQTPEEVVAWIDVLFSQQPDGPVIVEEKIRGVEFTLQCLVSGEYVLPTPVVQDYKKLLPGEQGPNTASMGSFSDTGGLLPFLDAGIVDEALDIIRRTVKAFRETTGTPCEGFLYGQFMLTRSGLKVVEYNFRPGDPEWMNTLIIMDDDLVEVIAQLIQGSPRDIRFRDQATVCKYIVPEAYPEKLGEILEVSFEEGAIRGTGTEFFYSCGIDAQGNYPVGSERGLAFVAAAPSVTEANRQVEEAIALVEGEFRHRPDIGTAELIAQKSREVEALQA